MVVPVPDHPTIGTPYGRRGRYWSCDRDAAGNGIHTGADFPAPAGARVVAARPGRLVHCNHGDSFGNHQVEVRCSDGTRDFYAHMRTRRAQGNVSAGDPVGEVGDEGNTNGYHLHFERHATATGGWSCGVVRDPQPSIDWEDAMSEDDWDRLRSIVADEVDRVWSDAMLVTQPGSGQDTTKARQQVLRELWQKVTRAT
jgi:murein DD-endopeptidase MepM/ murein hydrolase activator NlpD